MPILQKLEKRFCKKSVLLENRAFQASQRRELWKSYLRLIYFECEGGCPLYMHWTIDFNMIFESWMDLISNRATKQRLFHYRQKLNSYCLLMVLYWFTYKIIIHYTGCISKLPFNTTYSGHSQAIPLWLYYQNVWNLHVLRISLKYYKYIWI